MRVEKFKCEQCGAETGRGKEPNGWIVLKTEKILWYGNPTLKVDRIRREHFSNKDSSLDFCGYNCFEAYFRKLLGVTPRFFPFVTAECSFEPALAPRKTVKVVLEKFDSKTYFRIWSDLSKEEVESVPGIVDVDEYRPTALDVYIDPRYNVDHIKAYIEGMVHARS